MLFPASSFGWVRVPRRISLLSYYNYTQTSSSTFLLFLLNYKVSHFTISANCSNRNHHECINKGITPLKGVTPLVNRNLNNNLKFKNILSM